MENRFSSLAEKLRLKIQDGAFAPTGAFPSENALVRDFGVSRTTVRRALSELQSEGLLRRSQGASTRLTCRGRCASGKIGILFPDRQHIDVFPVMISELVRCGSRAGYSFFCGDVEGETSAERARKMASAVEMLISQRVEGVIFRPIVGEAFEAANLAALDQLKGSGVPVTLIDSAVRERDGCDVVGIDNVQAGRFVAEHLLATRRRRIAFLANSLPIGPTSNIRDRMFGVAGAVVSAGLGWSGNSEIPCSESDLRGLRRYLRKFRPDAIVCGSDRVARGLLDSLEQLGYGVPDEIAVAGFDDSHHATAGRVGLTTVRQPFKQIAATAFECLYRRILHPKTCVQTVNLPIQLIVRESTAQAQRKRRRA